jgi:hypothetical protein
VVGSPGNHVNTIPATVLARVWSRRGRARRGTRLRAQVGEPRAGEGRTAAARGLGAPASNPGHEKVRERGKKGRRGSSPRRGASAAAGH